MPPTNISMATALVIDALPYSNTQNLTGVLDQGAEFEPEFNLWYKLPASLVTSNMIVGARAFPDNVNPYGYAWSYINPPVGIYGTPYPSAEYPANSIRNGRIQIPLAISQDYYFRAMVADFTAPPTYNVTFTCYAAPANQATPTGSILVNSDVPGFPAVVVKPSTGEILAFLSNINHGETGDILPDGKILLSGASGTGLAYLYDSSLSLLTTVPLSANIGSGNQVNKFYAIEFTGGLRYIRAISNAGILGTQYGPLLIGPYPSPIMVAVTRDETKAYITSGAAHTSGGARVMQWDLTNNVAMADFVGAVTLPGALYDLAFVGLSPGGILVLKDNTVLVCYFQTNGATYMVRRYATDGTLLNTYPNPLGYSLDRIAHDPTDDGLTFWIWWKVDGKASFQRVRVSDGVVLSEAISAEVASGYRLKIDSTVDTQLFGHPFSCPFLILRSTTATQYGLFKIVPDKRTDHNGASEGKIPNPTFKTGLIP